MLDKELDTKSFIESKDIDVDYVINIVQNILDKNHKDPRKREIRPRLNGDRKEINFNCPICGDGSSIKFRGHLFLSNFYYVCYNEKESCSMSFTKFCNHFGVNLLPEKKLQIYNHVDNNFRYTKKDDFTIGEMDKLFSKDELFNCLNEKKNFLFNISPIIKDSIQHKYLIHRKIFNYENISQATYKFTDNWIEPVLIMTNTTGDKIIGMQIRNLKSQKEKRFFKFYNFEALYNLLNPNDKLDMIEAISYNKISAIFNILNVDFENIVYVCESFTDSLFLPNSIALVGLETDISFLKGENLDLRFVLDNDGSGEKKSKKMLEEGSPIFLWKKLFKDMSKGKGGPKLEHWLNENIKDVNKLAEYCDNANIYQDLKLDSYFARDKFDLIDL